MIGSQLSHYKITAKLGKGGMGEVYRADDTKLGREVAIKVLPAELAGDPERLERFQREARAIAALNHPNIVTIFSVEEASTIHFLTMELVEGHTLASEIPGGGMALKPFFELASAMASAIAAAHEKGITHRDLKPANVMVTAEGQVKVLDFGLAKLTESALAPEMTQMPTEALTQEGLVIGTIPYMSPEQVEGKPVDHRTDIFSLGILLYEMATGSRPFQGDTSPSLMSSILKDRPASADQTRTELPRHLGRVIGRCLEKDRRDRYQTARDIVNELRGLRREWDSGESTPTTNTQATQVATPVTKSADLTVAVLPFGIPADDDELSALSEGLTEDITTGLAKFAYITVADGAVSESSTANVQEISNRLGARFLLRGRIRRAGPMIRCSAHLVDAATGAHIWSENYDRKLDESSIFDIQDGLTDTIVGTVADGSGALLRSVMATIRKRPADELTVQDWLFRAITHLQQIKPDEHALVRDGLEQAVELEPDNAEAWAWLALMYLQEHQHLLNPRPDPLDRALEAARRAVDLDPASQAAWIYLAESHFHLGDLEAFHPAAERALALNPRDTNLAGVMGMMIFNTGQYERGFKITRDLMKMNPHYPGWYHFTTCYYYVMKGDLEQALREIKKVQMPELPWDPRQTAAVAGLLGRRAEAESALRALEKLGADGLDLARNEFRKWVPDTALHERMIDGLRKAMELVGDLEPSSDLPAPDEPSST